MKFVRLTLLALLVLGIAAPAVAGGWGAGASLFDGDAFGVQGRKTFVLGGDISQVTTGATLYFDNTWFAFDVDYHFIINPANPSRFYPLVGLELATDFDWAELGVNAGGGVDFMLTKTLGAFFELKYVISDADGFVGTLGVKF